MARKYLYLIAAGLLLAGGLRGFAAEIKPPAFNASFLWTGSWEWNGSFQNRLDGRISLADFTGRLQLLDKRPAFFWEDWQAGLTGLGGGLYHGGTGSRLLYGVLTGTGLQVRLGNLWGSSVRFADAYAPSTADLKTESSAKGERELYLYLASPRLGPVRLFALAQTDLEWNPGFGAGIDLALENKQTIRLEGFGMGELLAARTPSTWFAFPPVLPERDLRLYGLHLSYDSPSFAVAADGALSETGFWGRGLYGSLAFRIGDKPWKLDLGIDLAGDRFVDRQGAISGAGFRTAARFEYAWSKAALLRVSTALAAPALGLPLDRLSASAYYHFPSNLRFGGQDLFFQPVKLSLSAGRNAQDGKTALDSLGCGLGFKIGPVSVGFDASLVLSSPATGLFTGSSGPEFHSVKAGGELAYSPKPFQFRFSLGFTELQSKGPVWDTSLSAAVQGKFGRFSLKLSSPDFPRVWTGSLSWRLALKTP
ncbi:MAG: hypothetical protein LBT11_04465 [Treponema sp.]|nr:hypothetical protein [Treponema sp.]